MCAWKLSDFPLIASYFTTTVMEALASPSRGGALPRLRGFWQRRGLVKDACYGDVGIFDPWFVSMISLLLHPRIGM
ncbi:MAG: hypothetical protein IMW89_00970 [Ktedonobacteraceae bacterium]|nr:hypothetical protein [Ktedonobacteraceae bacterium]